MLGYSDAYLAAHHHVTGTKPGAKPPPVDTTKHTYGGDISDTVGAFLSSVIGPFTGAMRGMLVMDGGGTLQPGYNGVWNGTGRPEHLVPSGGGDIHLHLTVNGPVGSQQQLEDWFVKTANKTSHTGRLSQAVKAASR